MFVQSSDQSEGQCSLLLAYIEACGVDVATLEPTTSILDVLREIHAGRLGSDPYMYTPADDEVEDEAKATLRRAIEEDLSDDHDVRLLRGELQYTPVGKLLSPEAEIEVKVKTAKELIKEVRESAFKHYGTGRGTGSNL